MLSALKRIFFGVPLNPLNPSSRQHIALIALLAWVGLGADALSSSCYGPEQAYLALGSHSHLALYVATITVVTIFIIAIGYNQVVQLFPAGGGGYKVATKLLHPYVGLVSGAALIVDYVLTITVSIASGADAVFSFMPAWLGEYKLYIEAIAILLLLSLNLRGMKEAIQILLPIFLGFIVIHFILIVYGIIAHSQGMLTIIPITLKETHELAQSMGWLSVIGLTLHAYSLGSGTYTGLEAVSNNVQRLSEPRVKTARRTMFYMAVSLSFTAGGIILLYLLWDVVPVEGQTLNATVFHSMLGDSWFGRSMLVLVLILEAALLFVAANTGFADGPNVLSNMAVDGWLPSRFRYLSSRLVVQNGVLILGIAALAVLFWGEGNVSVLVILYSINVFITFSLSLLSLSVYWFKQRAYGKWMGHFCLSAFACLITTTILCITLFYKFTAGGWVTLLITSSLVGICLLIKRHYHYVKRKLSHLDKELHQPLTGECTMPLVIDPKQHTAIIYIKSLSVGMHTLLSVQRLFPNQFKNFVFLSVGEVDAECFRADEELVSMQTDVNVLLDYFVKFCCQNGLPAESYAAFGIDTVKELEILSGKVAAKYSNSIFFASLLMFAHDNMVTRFLHNQTPLILQQYLNSIGKELVIMPMKI